MLLPLVLLQRSGCSVLLLVLVGKVCFVMWLNHNDAALPPRLVGTSDRLCDTFFIHVRDLTIVLQVYTLAVQQDRV